MVEINTRHPNVSVTKKEKSFYKIVEKVDDENFLSPYTKTPYAAGESYNATIETNRSKTKIVKGIFGLTNKKVVRRFLHKKHRFFNPANIAIKCIIPAGSSYYFNPDTKEIMTENMIIEGPVSVKRKR